MEGRASDRGNFIAEMMLDTDYQDGHNMNPMFLAEQRLQDMENALHGIGAGSEGDHAIGKAHEPKRHNKKFECHYCHKSFRDSYNLKKHIRSHTGEKPFSCDVCHKKFARQYTLRVHQRIHTGETPYKCEVCHNTFRVRHLMTKHMERHHGGEHGNGKKSTTMKSGITPQNICIPHVTQSLSQPNVFFVDHTVQHDCDEPAFPVLDSTTAFPNEKAPSPYMTPNTEPILDSFGQSFLEAARTCTRDQFVAFVNRTEAQHPKAITSIFSLLCFLNHSNHPLPCPINSEQTEAFIERATVACYDLISQRHQQTQQEKQRDYLKDNPCPLQQPSLKQSFERANPHVRRVLFYALDLSKDAFLENSNSTPVLERRQALIDALVLLHAKDASGLSSVSKTASASELRQLILYRISQDDEDAPFASLRNELWALVDNGTHLTKNSS